MSEKITIAVWDAYGLAKSGALVELFSGATGYTGVELGTSGRYHWASIPLGKYFLYVNSINTGESFAVGEGELAGLGYQENKYLFSEAAALRWQSVNEEKFVKTPVSSFALLPTPSIGLQCFVTGEDAYYQVGSDGTWRKRGIAEIEDLGTELAKKLSKTGGTMTGALGFELSGDIGASYAINFLSDTGNTEMHISASGLSGKDGALADWWYLDPDSLALNSTANEHLYLTAGNGLQIYSTTGYIGLSGTTGNKLLYMSNDTDNYIATLSTGGGAYTPYLNLYDGVNGATLETTDLTFNGVSIFTTFRDSVNYTTYNTAYVPTGSEPTGTRYWDSTLSTPSVVLGGGVIGQEFEELFYHIVNQSGATIADGTVVAYGGTLGSSGRLKGILAIADGTQPAFFSLGIATESIANGGNGRVTKFGVVRGLNTTGASVGETWEDEDILYVHPTIPGALTKVMPNAPLCAIPICVVMRAHATAGTIFVRPTYPVKMVDLCDVNGTPLTTSGQFAVWNDVEQYFDFTANINDYLLKSNITKQGSGFDTPATVQVAYDSATRKITLAGTGQGYWRHTAIAGLTAGWVSDARPDTAGVWYLKHNGSTYSWSNTQWGFDEVQIAFGIKSATAEIWLRECHGLMDYLSHQDEHQARGTYKTAGGDFSGYTLASTTATNRRPQISSTTLWDEDLPAVLPALLTNAYAWFWLTGAGVANIASAQTEIIPVTGSQPRYNQFTTSWGQTAFPVNAYGKIFVVAVPTTNDLENEAKRYLFIQPQTVSTSLTTIQAVTSDTVNWGDFAGILPEFNFIGEIIVRYTASDWRLISVQKINGSRANQSVAGSGFLSTVSSDPANFSGDGTPASPLSIVAIAQSQVTNLVTDLAGKIDTSATAQTKAGALTIEATQASTYNTTEATATPTGILGNIASNISNTTGTASYHEVRAKNATTQTARGFWGIVSGANAYTQSAMFWGFRTASAAFTEVMRLTTAGALSLIGALDVTGILTATAGAVLKHSGTTRIETTTTGAKVTGDANATNASKTVQTSSTTTGAINWNLTNGAIMHLSSALTGAVTINISNPVVGSKCELHYTQGTSIQNITLSSSGVRFNQTRSATTGTGTMDVALNTVSNGYYRITLEWITATLCHVVLS